VDALEPVLRADGVDLEDLQIASAGRRSQVRVIVDADSGMDLDGIARISQVISSALDDPGVAGAALDEATLAGPYTLEVSSPGVDRPLTLSRHWRRNIDRLVIIRTHSGDDVRGRIVEVGDGHATIEVEAAGKAARAQGDRTQIQFDDVQRATIEVEFRRQRRRREIPVVVGDLDTVIDERAGSRQANGVRRRHPGFCKIVSNGGARGFIVTALQFDDLVETGMRLVGQREARVRAANIPDE